MGNRFVKPTPWAYKEGVFYADFIKKYIVRVRYGKCIKTVCSFSNKEEAGKEFKRLINDKKQINGR